MTKAELIKELEQYDDDAVVCIMRQDEWEPIEYIDVHLNTFKNCNWHVPARLELRLN